MSYQYCKHCSAVSSLQIVRGDINDYRSLCRYHYRNSSLGVYSDLFALKYSGGRYLARAVSPGVVGVIVYRMPVPGIELRNLATGGAFVGLGDKAGQMQWLNRYVRCISRVIIEPRYRSLGLASKLVAETMPRLGVPFVEAMAVMGRFNPFFARAGMTGFSAAEPVRCVQLREALEVVGVDEVMMVDPDVVGRHIEQLCEADKLFINNELDTFMQAYGKRRGMSDSAGRLEFALSRLSARPVYYIWKNKNYEWGPDNVKN